MGPFKVIFNDLYKLIHLVFSLLSVLWRIKRDILFLFSSALFAFSIFIVLGMYVINCDYYRFINRGIWEDVMISRRDGQDFVSLRKFKSDFEKVKFESVNRLQFNQEEFDRELKRLKHDPRTMEAVVGAVRDILGNKIKAIVVSKTAEASLNIEKVLINDRDVSRIHGQLDVWIKAVVPYNSDTASFETPPLGSIILSKNLAEKLSREIASNQKKTKIYIRRWGESPPEDALRNGFDIFGIVDTGGSSNSIAINPGDIGKFGDQKWRQRIGIDVGKANPSKIKKLLMDKLGSQYWIELADEKGGVNRVAMLRFLFIPFVLLGLFSVIMIINYGFVVLYNYENRETESDLMVLYNYGTFKRVLLYSLLNILPSFFGFLLAVLLVIIDWPVSISGMLVKIGESLPVKLSRFAIVQDPYAWGVLIICVIFFLLWSCAFLCIKKSEITVLRNDN